MEEEGLVSGDGWISDDSSFYGDEDEQDRLTSLCQDFDPDQRWLHHRKSLNALLKDIWKPSTSLVTPELLGATYRPAMEGNPYQPSKATSGFFGLDRKAMEEERLARLSKEQRAVATDLSVDYMRRSAPTQRNPTCGQISTLNEPSNRGFTHEPELHNIYEGKKDAWQLHETAEQFVSRLPPISTPSREHEWIWCANPYPDGRATSRPSQQAILRSRGLVLLEQSSNKRHNIQVLNSSEPKGFVSKLLAQETDDLKQRLGQLAEETDVLTGKWMIFPELEDLTRTWIAIVEGTSGGRLGCSAKVATDSGRQGARLICVYTKDFRDVEDVRRVLQELASMGLAGSGRGIFYKSDVYTLLDIYGTNAANYGLQASIYSSQKMLASRN